jgi:hypothetical protein
MLAVRACHKLATASYDNDSVRKAPGDRLHTSAYKSSLHDCLVSRLLSAGDTITPAPGDEAIR